MGGDHGFLSITEFREGLDRLQVPWAEVTGVARLQTVLKALDLSGNGAVSVDELLRIRYDVPLFHPGDDGAISLLFIAGPTARRRREAVNFFDELRILAH